MSVHTPHSTTVEIQINNCFCVPLYKRLRSRPMALGKQIKHYRTKAGLTLEQLEDLSGVDKGTLGALEVRDSKRSQYTGQIAAAFGLTSDQLCDETTDHPLRSREASPAYDTSKAPIPSEQPTVPASAPIPINSRAAGTTWPFDTPLSQVLRLSDRDLGRIDGFMLALVQASTSTAARQSSA